MFTYLQENYQPKRILEFGFNIGHSATWFLRTFNEAKLRSYDPKEYTIADEKIWTKFTKRYRTRFSFRAAFSAQARRYENPDVFDIIFIDGGHTFGAVYDDIETALMLRIPVILIDNMELTAQQNAVKYWESNLQIIKQFPYYTKNRDGNTYERYVNLYHVLNYDIREP